MAKYQKVFKGILFTVLWMVLLLVRGIRKGLYIVLFRWCSWQIAAVGVILVISLLCLVIWTGHSRIRRKILCTCLVLLLPILLIQAGRYFAPFSYEVHPVQVEAGEDVVLFRPKVIMGYQYHIGRKGGLVKISPEEYPVSLYGHFSPYLYEATIEDEELVFRVQNEQKTECCRMDTVDIPKVTGKDWALFFLNGYTVLYLGGMVWLCLSEKIRKNFLTSPI